uniref:RNA-directed DNA polymerase n=1 Tax=Bos indicus x Bos taurus TaxID=30522 RepID=A0A4W2DCI3_BOBOX
MPSSHLILCCPLLLLPPIPPSIRVFSNESTLRMRWPKYWSFSFSIIPSKEIPGLISFRMDWLDLLAVQGTLKSLLQHHSSKTSILRHSAFFTVQLSHPYMTTGKTIALTRRTFVGKVMSLLLNMLSRLVITFLPRSKRLLISWLQSPSAVILEPRKSLTCIQISQEADQAVWYSHLFQNFPVYCDPHSQRLMGSIKDRNGRDLTEAEDIKKRWQEYTEKLYKKDLHDPDNHDGVITDLEPDILECEVKWALESITTNKASGGDGIPVELFQILKDDAVKVLYSVCQQIWKTQQWPQDWKRSGFIPIPKKGNAKECSNYRTIALISHASKVMLKILQARLQQYVNCELSDVQAGFRKGRGTRDQIANIRWIMEKAREFQKNICFCFIDYTKAFDCVDHNKLWKIMKDVGIPDHLTCLFGNLYAGQEATVRTGHGTTDWFQIGKGVRQGCILSPCLFNFYAS